MDRHAKVFIPRAASRVALTLILAVFLAACASTEQASTEPGEDGMDAPDGATEAEDPRTDLAPGWQDAEQVAWNIDLVSHRDRPGGFVNSANPGAVSFWNSDLAFIGNYAIQGNYAGFQVWDISNPNNPTLRTAFNCPGGQGDVSVYGDLLFMSVEQSRGRLDCGGQGVEDTVSTERFRGLRVFDISDLDAPEQVAAVQTCRGSHTHSLANRPDDGEDLYVYVQGTGYVRPSAELEGCSDLPPERDSETSYFQIEVVRVPLDAPQDAEVVNEPRIFAQDGRIAGLWPGGSHGPETQMTSMTNQCHDITTYPAIGLAAGACSGNGLLLDISDPANPERIDYVSDPNFAYWHSATFDNEGSTVLFSDEWGGGTAPHCRRTDPVRFGANALFTLSDGELSDEAVGYYKLPAVQGELENCVAHNGSLVPVPGRDIMVQAWYQGGTSVLDFTDPSNPYEIAYFDRGPVDANELRTGGYWSSYWYNGYIVGSEIGRGLDIMALQPSEHLSENEIEAARLVQFDQFNAQMQPHITWPARFVVARAYIDQLMRNADQGGVERSEVSRIADALEEAEAMDGAEQSRALSELSDQVADLEGQAVDEERIQRLASVLQELADS